MLGFVWLGLFGCSGTDGEKKPTSEQNIAVIESGKESVKEAVIESSKKEDTEPTQDEEKTTIKVSLFFTNQEAMKTGQGELLQKVLRELTEVSPQSLLDALYAGPQESETGLVLTSCLSTGATFLGLEDGVATVQLQGGCGGCGTHSIADLITPTLTSLAGIDFVHLQDPQGKSMVDTQKANSRPACLEP